MTSQLLYHGSISGVRFRLNSSESIRDDSFVQVKTHDLFRGNIPYPNGIVDAHMGTTDNAYCCQTCHNTKRDCIGHSGHIVLNYPVYSPPGIGETRRWIRLICFECGKPCISADQYRHFDAKVRLDEASKIARTANRKCVHCSAIHPIIKKNKDGQEHLALVKEIWKDKNLESKEPLYPHEIGAVLSRISDATVLEMGRSLRSHASNTLILKYIRVPGTPIRPDSKKAGGRSTNDDLTTMLQILVKKNDALPPIIPAQIDAKTEKAIYELNNAYYDFIKAGGENAMNSISSRLKGKMGRFRKNQMGKRVRMMCRGTIMGDSRLRIDEVGVPLVFARTIQIPETVQEYNKARLMRYVLNGSATYPGASRIIDGVSGQELNVDAVRDPELKIGDIVMRDMIDGDHVNFNRQPSLKPSNVATHFAKILRDPRFKTLMMNVISCVLYNADFDGDQMHLVISSAVDARNEIAQLSSVSNWFVSHAYSSPSIGQADDSVIGLAELTRSNINFDKFHAMKLFQTTSELPSFDDYPEAGLSGRDLVSLVMARTPINFTRTPTWYDPNMAARIKYDPTEIRVEINQGKLTQGILDKKSIGKDASGGIYHIIANEYGANAALTSIFDMQQLAIANTLLQGYTIGIMDLMISDDAKREIDSIAADIINKSRVITEELQNGEIVPPIGKTVEGFFEEQQINTLAVFEDFTDPILRAINPQTNNLFKLVAFGSKGKLPNVINMMSAGGQKLINGERIKPKFGFKRTLAYFPRFDTSPESRGYIANSFLTGMTSSEYVFDAMAARFDLISKALSTSITGEQNRKSVKNLESIIVSNHRWCIKHTRVVQMAYGEDFLDPRRVELVHFPTVMSSDAVFAAKYKHDKYPAFFETMLADRRKYRDIFLRVEDMNVKELISDRRRMPVDVARIIVDICRENDDRLAADGTDPNLAKMVDMVSSLCTGIPYVIINEIQERLKTPVPEYIQAACWLLCMSIRSYLHPMALVAARITPEVLDLIIAKIRTTYARALVEPGTAVGIIAAMSFSEPLTQYMLDAHHRSASGGTSKSTVVKTKEILGARPVDRLINPSMLLPVSPEFSGDKARVQEIANQIEMMKLRQFVQTWQIFAEKYGEPIHTRFAAERAFIAEFGALNPLLQPPGDLARWCIRFAIDRTAMILKNMTMELLISRLRETFPDTYIVYTPENAPSLVVRVYMRLTMFKGTVVTNQVRDIKDRMAETIIRGIDGIRTTNVVMMLRNKINLDGSISRDENRWGISTVGTNLVGVLTHPQLDAHRIVTDAIQEIAAVLGIEAARQAIVTGLRGLIDSINHRHYLIYADEMTFTGRVTSIESTGLKSREASNVLLRMGFTSPLAIMEDAAVTAADDAVTGVTAPLLVGSVPRIGTLYNSFQVNTEFVKANVKRPDDILEALFA